MAKHHLGGLYLEEILGGLLREVGESETPMQTMVDFMENLPPHIQRDILCSFIRETRKQIRRTVAEEIAEHVDVKKDKNP